MERDALDRARTRLVALRAEQYRLLEDIAELERLGVARRTGDRATPRLLQDLSTLDLHEARRLTEESADLAPRSSLLGEPLPPRLPVTATVYASGEIGPAHVVIIRRTMAHLERLETVSVEDWSAAERLLADDATRLPPRLLARVAARLILQFDPDGEVPPEGEDCRDELHVVRRRDGRLEFKGRLHDPVDGEVFLGAIDPLAEPFGPDDTRSLARRRIDALMDIVGDSPARRRQRRRPSTPLRRRHHPTPATGTDADAADEDDDAGALIPRPRRPESAPAPARTPRPGRALLTITMDLRWLQLATGYGALDTGTPVDPATVRRWACDADIVPVVLGSQVRAARRGAGCSAPSPTPCAGPSTFATGAARSPAATGPHDAATPTTSGSGDTAATPACDNLVLLCRHHHQVIHHGHWTVAILDGLPWFTPPSWIDPDQQPRPGGRPRVPL